MPELPEITALAERLADRVQDRALTSITPLQFSALKTAVPAPESLLGRPVAPLSGLDEPGRAALVEAVRAVLAEALVAERRRTGGLPAKLGDHFAVHGRAGLPCPRCEADLRRVSYDSHEVAYCPPCQTGGKVLADRRLSRLVR